MFFDRKRNVVLTLVILSASACGPVEKLPEEEEQGFSSSDAPGRIQSNLTSSQHRARCDAIKTSSSGKGITNGLVIAGVAQLETQMGHCWSEATSSCQGPYSSYCGGPVLAGAADGPCYLRQGGLGMYQFDSGTYDQTLAEQGTPILSLSGNISRAVSFIINKVWSCPNTPYFNSESEVIALDQQGQARDDRVLPVHEGDVVVLQRLRAGLGLRSRRDVAALQERHGLPLQPVRPQLLVRHRPELSVR